MSILISFLATLIPLVMMDAVWILVLAKKFYANQIGFLMTQPVNILPVGVFYPMYAFCTVFLVVLPALQSKSWVEALWRGALLGLAAYGAYDLTNHATIAKWTLAMTLVDIGWGVFVTACVSVIAFHVISAAQ